MLSCENVTCYLLRTIESIDKGGGGVEKELTFRNTEDNVPLLYQLNNVCPTTGQSLSIESLLTVSSWRQYFSPNAPEKLRLKKSRAKCRWDHSIDNVKENKSRVSHGGQRKCVV